MLDMFCSGMSYSADGPEYNTIESSINQSINLYTVTLNRNTHKNKNMYCLVEKMLLLESCRNLALYFTYEQ